MPHLVVAMFLTSCLWTLAWMNNTETLFLFAFEGEVVEDEQVQDNWPSQPEKI